MPIGKKVNQSWGVWASAAAAFFGVLVLIFRKRRAKSHGTENGLVPLPDFVLISEKLPQSSAGQDQFIGKDLPKDPSILAWLKGFYHTSAFFNTLLIVMVVGLGAACEWQLLAREFAWAGVCFIAASVCLYACARRNRIEPEFPNPPTFIIPKSRWFYGILAASILSILIAINVARENLTPADFQFNLIGWFVSILLFGGSLLGLASWRPPSFHSIVSGMKRHQLEILGVIAILLVALLARSIDLEIHPYAYGNDESNVGLEAVKIINGTTRNMFATGWSAQPYLSFLPTSLSILMFGQTIFAVRIVSAIEGVLTILFLYLLAREVFDWKLGLLAAASLIYLPPHLHFSRLGFNNILPGLFGALVVWLIFRAFRTGRISSYLWAGLAAGSTWYTYVGSRLVLAVGIGILGFAILFQKGFLKRYWPHILTFILAAMIVMAPMMSWFAAHPGSFWDRISTESLFKNGWVQAEMTNKNLSVTQVMLSQLERSSLVFVSDPAVMSFFESPYPYFPAAAAVFMILGMGFAITQWRRPFYIAILGWFWSNIIFGGVFTPLAPQNQRLVMALPAAAMLVAIGLYAVVRFAANISQRVARWIYTLSIVLLLVVCVQEVSYYFGEYREFKYFYNSTDAYIAESIKIIKAAGPETPAYFFTQPMLNSTYPNYRFLLGGYPLTTVDEDLTTFLKKLDPTNGGIFFFLPQGRALIDQLKTFYPGGTEIEVQGRTMREPLMLVYQLQPQP